ncbi:MAG TPA: YpdA family putative bacillithiol disulfide reductase [Terriglobia bacterium]|nr:YpdA family putative bacillithiol disulfide reductase [Terriglobia bacterium]
MTELMDVIIVGAGPTGLACGIEAVRAGLKTLIVEKGCLVNSLFTYPANMTFFTSRELLEIGELPLPSTNVKPTRAEALEYYRRVADYFHLPIHYQERVNRIRRSPLGRNPGAAPEFEIETETSDGAKHTHLARTAIIATGYYDLPNYLGIPGEDLPKVSHYAREGHEYFGRKVAVIGGANSAAVTSLDLYRHGAEVTLVNRGRELSRHIKYWIRPDLENRIKANAIRAYWESRVTEITHDSISIQTEAGQTVRLENDFVFALTGYHPDVDLLRGAGIQVHPESYRPALNPETLESNVPGLYVAGVVVSGLQTNEIFIENGRFHGKLIIADIKRKICR